MFTFVLIAFVLAILTLISRRKLLHLILGKTARVFELLEGAFNYPKVTYHENQAEIQFEISNEASLFYLSIPMEVSEYRGV